MSEFLRMLGRNATLLGGVLLAALLVVAAVVRLPPVQRWTAARIATRLPPGVAIQRATISVLPPGLRLTQVSLADGSVLRSVSCYARLGGLLAGRLELTRVNIKGADITVERTVEGGLRLSTAPAANDAIAAWETALPAIPPFDAWPAIAIKDASVTLIDRQARNGPQTLHLRAVHFTLASPWADSSAVAFGARLDPAGRLEAQGSLRRNTGGAAPDGARTVSVTAKATGLDAQTVFGYIAAAAPGGGSAKATGALDGSLTLTGRFPGGVVGDATLSADAAASVVWDQVHLAAPLTLSGQFAAGRDGVTISNGQLSIAQLSAARIAASDVGVEFGYGAGALSVTTARATLYGGTWSQRGSVTVADPPAFDTTVNAEGIDCAALLTALTGAPPQYGCDQFSADAVLRGTWTGARTVARNAQGTGSVALRGGTIPAASVIGAIWQAVVPFIHASKELNDVAAPPTHVDHLTQSFTLQDGLLRTGDLALVADDYTITGSGTIGVDGSLDLRTEIAMTAEGVTKMLTMAALPIPQSAALPPIPARIAGSFDRPIIRPQLASLPTDAIQSLVLDARGAGNALKDAAGSGLEQLQHGFDTLW